MTITKTLGGNRVGSGKKMDVELHNYFRSTHDLSNVFRTTMSCGTLVPFMQHLGLNGDTFDINLNTLVRTLPTTAPLFGSFKVQLDVFMTPIRLYNANLHMNKQNVGMNMSEIKFPLMKIAAKGGTTKPTVIDKTNYKFDQSCLLAYLGVRGAPIIRTTAGAYLDDASFQKNALGLLAYWHTYANYYANKQEEIGMMISNSNFQSYTISNVVIDGTNAPFDPDTGILTTPTIVDTNIYISASGILDAGDLKFQITSEGYTYWANSEDLFDITKYDQTTTIFTLKDTALNPTLIQISPIKTTTTPDKVLLKSFKLSNIDDMQLKILQHVGNTAFELNEVTATLPYLNCIGQVYPTVYQTNYFSQNGLGIKTYQSDIFNNWLNTEWIDGDNGVNSITAIDTSSGEFKLDTFLMAKKVYNILNRIAVSGGTYEDWQEAVYGESALRRAETPIYCGGYSTELIFEEVVSQASATVDTTKQPLGTLAGRGTQGGKSKGGNIYVRVEEPSIIMGICSITPRVDYSQGNDWITRLTNMDQLHKPGMDGIGFQEAITEQFAHFDAVYWNDIKTYGYRSAGKQPAWIEYMTNFNKVYGHFAENSGEDAQMQCVLNRQYEFNADTQSIKDLTTYIDPTKYNYAFAVADLTAQNFWMQIANNVTARRLMSAKVIPNL